MIPACFVQRVEKHPNRARLDRLSHLHLRQRASSCDHTYPHTISFTLHYVQPVECVHVCIRVPLLAYASRVRQRWEPEPDNNPPRGDAGYTPSAQGTSPAAYVH